MANLRSNESGGLYCPKVRRDIDPAPSNLGGCSHCVFAQNLRRETAENYSVTCAIVPQEIFCMRMHFFEDGSWGCKLRPSLNDYKNLTGDLAAADVPRDFYVPYPTTLTKCLLCAGLAKPECQPTIGGLEAMQRALARAAFPEVVATYPPAQTKAATQMLEVLRAINPGWKSGASVPIPPPVSDPCPEIPDPPGEGRRISARGTLRAQS